MRPSRVGGRPGNRSIARIGTIPRVRRPRGPTFGVLAGFVQQAPAASTSDVPVPRLAADDESLSAAAQRALAAEVRERRPLRVHVIRIDGWFSRRWLLFAGNVLSQAGDSTRLAIPPFVPARVLHESHWTWDGTSAAYAQDPRWPAFHRGESSAESRLRELPAQGSSCVALWLGVSPRERRAAAMFYGVGPPTADAWYASFDSAGGSWDVESTCPLARVEARRLFGLATA